MMTLEQFRATGRDVADLREALGDVWDEVRPGRVYAGNLHIEGSESAGWCLTIYNESWAYDPLEVYERRLYEFGVEEGSTEQFAEDCW